MNINVNDMRVKTMTGAHGVQGKGQTLGVLLILWLALLCIAVQPVQAQEPPDGAVITYFHSDVAGTPLMATDASGQFLWEENYRPYGAKLNNQAAAGTNTVGYAGKPFDNVYGLSYQGARYYDPVLGRFMGIDPVEAKPESLHSFNRYAYANNNPYKFVDPDGQWAQAVLYGIDVLLIGYGGYTAYQEGGWKAAAKSVATDGVITAATMGTGVPIKMGLQELKAANGARELAKTEVFAARTAPELKKIYGWGNGESGVKAAREALDASAMDRIQSSVTRAEVEATRNLYREAAAAGRGGAVAPERAAYMEDILKFWK